MWLMIEHAIHEIQRSSWNIKLFWGALVLLSSFSLGSLGGFSIQTIKMKLIQIKAPTPLSGNVSAPSTTSSLSQEPRPKRSGETWMIRKYESAPSNTKTTDGK